MFNSYKKLFLVPLFGLLLTGNAFATSTNTIPPNVLTGINGLINVSEQPCGDINMVVCNNAPFTFGVQYSLSILDPISTLSVSDFAISTNTMAYPGEVRANRNGWFGTQYTPANWNDSFNGIIGPVGSFSSLFGTDLYVNLFSAAELTNPIITSSDGIFEFFYDQGADASNFVALNANGVIIDQSLRTNTVPEPAPLALLGFGLLGLGLMRKRHRS